MTALRRRLSNRAIAGIIVGILLLIVVGFWLDIRITADRAWAAMEKRTHDLIEEARARPAARPVLRGTAEPGNAWTDYEAAAKLWEPLKPNRTIVFAFVTRRPEADRAAVQKLIATNGSIIEHLRRGTRRAEVSYAYDWERAGSLNMPPLLSLQDLGSLAVAQSRLLREAGRHREALETLLDTAQFGGDVRRNGVAIADMIGLAIIFVALDELRDLLATSPLAAQDLARVDRELEILDRHWSDFGITLRNESMSVQASLLAADRSYPAEYPSFPDTWRYGFSRKLMSADAGTRVGRWLEEFRAQESMAWPDRLKAGEEMQREVKEDPNPLARGFYYGGIATSASVRQKRAQLRLLRVATRFRMDGSVMEIDDPFGDKILSVRTGNHLKLWSRGRDGIDNGGKGEWSRDDRGADIVLEFTR